MINLKLSGLFFILLVASTVGFGQDHFANFVQQAEFEKYDGTPKKVINTDGATIDVLSISSDGEIKDPYEILSFDKKTLKVVKRREILEDKEKQDLDYEDVVSFNGKFLLLLSREDKKRGLAIFAIEIDKKGALQPMRKIHQYPKSMKDARLKFFVSPNQKALMCVAINPLKNGKVAEFAVTFDKELNSVNEGRLTPLARNVISMDYAVANNGDAYFLNVSLVDGTDYSDLIKQRSSKHFLVGRMHQNKITSHDLAGENLKFHGLSFVKPSEGNGMAVGGFYTDLSKFESQSGTNDVINGFAHISFYEKALNEPEVKKTSLGDGNLRNSINNTTGKGLLNAIGAFGTRRKAFYELNKTEHFREFSVLTYNQRMIQRTNEGTQVYVAAEVLVILNKNKKVTSFKFQDWTKRVNPKHETPFYLSRKGENSAILLVDITNNNDVGINSDQNTPEVFKTALAQIEISGNGELGEPKYIMGENLLIMRYIKTEITPAISDGNVYMLFAKVPFGRWYGKGPTNQAMFKWPVD